MRLLTSLLSVLIFLGTLIRSEAAFADIDPRPGSQTAIKKLVENHRSTVTVLFKFEAASAAEILNSNSYMDYREQVLTTLFLGLDNIDSAHTNQLILDLAAVNFGESIAPIYSCLVQRKSKTLVVDIQKYRLSNSWCIDKLVAKFCLSTDEASQRLRNALKKAKNTECDVPLY